MRDAHDGGPSIACDLSRNELGAQAERWMRLGRDAGLGRTGTEDGVRIRFRDDPAAERELRALVAVESDCCRWARWEVYRAGGELVLQVRSAQEGAVALQAMFGTGEPVPFVPKRGSAADSDDHHGRHGRDG